MNDETMRELIRQGRMPYDRVVMPDGTVHTREAERLAAPDAEGVSPPPCPDHEERQHRDRQPPWCDLCGWSHGIVVPARKIQ